MRKVDVLGIGVTAATYDEITRALLDKAERREPAAVTALAVHGLTLGRLDGELGNVLRSFDVVTPDGQPIRWAMNLLADVRLQERVYGPTLMRRLCERAAREGVSVALYGSHDYVLARLKENLVKSIPELRIAHTEPSLFRPLTEQEDRDLVRRLRESGCGIVFVGLGCPLQERWVYEHRDQLDVPLVAVGAAFDFHAGNKPQAPAWMQARGLEWLFRLASEPKRLWKRYLVYNSLFLWFLGGQLLRRAITPKRSRGKSVAKRI